MTRDEAILASIREALAKAPGHSRVELTPLGDPAEESRITSLIQTEFPALEIVFVSNERTETARKARGGRRPGAGRPPSESVGKAYKLTLLPEQHAAIRARGGAAWLAEVVREALAEKCK